MTRRLLNQINAIKKIEWWPVAWPKRCIAKGKRHGDTVRYRYSDNSRSDANWQVAWRVLHFDLNRSTVVVVVIEKRAPGRFHVAA